MNRSTEAAFRAMEHPIAPLSRQLLDALEAAGVNPPALALRCQIAPQRLSSGVTPAELDRFLCAAWAEVNDSAFGLKAGQALRPERLGLTGLLVMTSPTLLSALQRKARYSPLAWGDRYRVVVSDQGVDVLIDCAVEHRPYGPAKVDMEVSSLVAMARLFTGHTVVPRWVRLRQPAPAHEALYHELLGCPVHFGEPDNRVALRASDADLPFLSAQAEAGQALEIGAQALLRRCMPDKLSARTRALVDQLMGDGEPSLARVAAKLCMSERTVQRRLALEGTHFRAIVDSARRDLAEQALGQGDTSADALAWRLGFSEAASFYRAFKRWTGQTPGQARGRRQR
jgi:AraC-like DNA-binding protein